MKTSIYILLIISLFVTACSPASVESASAEEPATLLFTIGMHLEPLGVTAQGFKGGRGDYTNENLFSRHVQDILTLTKIVESHGGAMTIQTQSPFTTMALHGQFFIQRPQTMHLCCPVSESLTRSICPLILGLISIFSLGYWTVTTGDINALKVTTSPTRRLLPPVNISLK